MAGPSRTLTLSLLADTSKFGKPLGDAEKQTKTFGEKLAKIGKVAAVAFTAVAAGALVVGKKLFDVFEAASTANARLENIVESMGNFGGASKEVTDRLVDQAAATARLTGVDRNLIKESQALLLTFDSVNKTAGEAGGIFDRASKAALDLAAAGFGSATGNATQLGKALEDPIKGLTALTRSGVTFTDAEKDKIRVLVESGRVTEAQGLILEAIEKQVGGTAEATANASAKIRESFSQVVEKVALALGPTFEKLAEIALQLVDRFDGVADSLVQRLTPYLERLQAFLVNKALPAIQRLAVFVRDEVLPVLQRWAGFVRDNVLPAVQSLIGYIVDVVVPALVKTFTPIVRALAEAFELVAGKIEDNREKFAAYYRSIEPIVTFIITRVAPVIGTVLGGAFRVLGTIIGGAIDVLARFLELISKVITKVVEFTRKVADSPIGSAIGSIIGGITGRYSGGPVVRNRPYLVGERGPELFVPGASGTIRRDTSTAGTGPVIINVSGTVLDPEGTARALQRVLTQSARRVGVQVAA
jgi:phage-related protein